MSTEKVYQATLVSHTHWDRAWYVTFQEFRVRLVRLVDRLVHLLETRPDYRVYMLDGQMVVLEDYLEVRPQRVLKLQSLAREGRLQVGPWYVLADEFLASPESLIRNLMLGDRLGVDYGGVMKIGYVPDGFGHIAQLPQILRGFGIDNAFFWRGVGAEGDRLGTEFEWSAPDGSTVTAILMPWGYHNISNLGYPIHWGDTSQMQFDEELALEQIRQALNALKPMSHTYALLLMNGIDHAEAEPRVPEIVARANTLIADTEIHHGTLAEHLGRVRAARKPLPQFEGEFRWGRYSEILQGVYATRIHLKQINQRVETLLERYVEPLHALASLAGAPVPEGTTDLIWTAWRWLLKNHPHDDMYGSGVDAVHEEMLYRFSQAEQIGQAVVRDSLRQIARQADFTTQSGTPVLVYNPLGWERRETAVGDIDFDFDDSTANDFQLVDHGGKRVPYQILDDENVFWMETLKPNRKRRVRVAFKANVPACGYATFYAQPRRENKTPTAKGEWIVRKNGAENGFLKFRIAPDGGLNVTDKTTGHTYRGLHHFYDVDDAGDEYSYCPCAHSKTVSTVGGKAEVSREADGECMVTFRLARTLRVPEGLTDNRQHRVQKHVALSIVSDITLYRDQPGLYIETRIENCARDHKLSVVFPTGLNPAQATVDESFAVMPRDIDLPDSTGWVEDPTPLMHQRAFTDLSEGGRGLAILNRGLPAVEVTRTRRGTQIALILLRSVGWLSRDDLATRRIAAGPLVPTPGAQCLGAHRYEYAILPHTGDWHMVYPIAYNYVAPLLVTRGDTHEGLELREMNITRDDPARIKPIPLPRGGSNPDTLSFVEIKPPQFVLTAVRRTADGRGVVVRFYNVDRQAATAQIACHASLQAAYRLNLNEERQEALSVHDERIVRIPARRAEVVTVELVPKPQPQ
jgi:mannosylglycerate hydrolase